HLERTLLQDGDGASCRRSRGASGPHFGGLPLHVTPNRFAGLRRQLDHIDELHLVRVVAIERERFANATSCFVDRASLRLTPLHRLNGCPPPPRFVSFVSPPQCHRFRHPLPRHGSRSRSIARRSPGPIVSPAWTGIVVRHFPHSTRTCEPCCRTSTQP